MRYLALFPILILGSCQALPDDHAVNTQLGRALAPLRSSLDPGDALDGAARRLTNVRKTSNALVRHEQRAARRLLAKDGAAATMLSPATMARRTRNALADAGTMLDPRWQPLHSGTEAARNAAAPRPGRPPTRVERVLQLLR